MSSSHGLNNGFRGGVGVEDVMGKGAFKVVKCFVGYADPNHALPIDPFTSSHSCSRESPLSTTARLRSRSDFWLLDKPV